ncbi:MAG: arsenate reductase (glutaredoxin), partial [Gammaproteobacteria bacterium]|nr:arsenate reductase (glutaredoxin) [Gammaproteobacteria bacterium]
MAKVTIWHNPRCTKSRETLALLQSRDNEIRIIEYLKNPP